MNTRIRMMKFGKIRGIVLLTLIGIILTTCVGGTIAWLSTNTAPLTNTFTPGEVGIYVEERFDGGTKSSVIVKNEGNTDVFVRVAIVGYWVNDSGDVVAPWNGSITPGQGWTKEDDGYYYYNSKVSAEGETTNLLAASISATPLPDNVPANSKLVVDVLAQAIQAEPVKAVNDAWHWTQSSN